MHDEFRLSLTLELQQWKKTIKQIDDTLLLARYSKQAFSLFHYTHTQVHIRSREIM